MEDAKPLNEMDKSDWDQMIANLKQKGMDADSPLEFLKKNGVGDQATLLDGLFQDSGPLKEAMLCLMVTVVIDAKQALAVAAADAMAAKDKGSNHLMVGIGRNDSETVTTTAIGMTVACAMKMAANGPAVINTANQPGFPEDQQVVVMIAPTVELLEGAMKIMYNKYTGTVMPQRSPLVH